MPAISVIMPVYNAEKYIRKSIESILYQTFEDFELVLIDDCGNDKSMEIARQFSDERIRIIENADNIGISSSRNRGIKESHGKYIALMDDDDIASEERLKHTYEFLEKNSEFDAVGGRYCEIDENDNMVRISPDPLINPKFVKASLMFYNPMGNGSTLIKKDFLYRNEIYYKNNYFGMEDYKMWADCSLKGRITNIDEVILYWRRSKNNESSRVLDSLKSDRAKIFTNIQKYTLINNGFVFSDEDMDFLCDMFPEDQKSVCAGEIELKKLLELLKQMIYQAENIHMDNLQEIKTVCRKQFSKVVENSKIWVREAESVL